MFGGIPNSPSFRTRLKIQCLQAHGPDLGAEGRLRGKKEGCSSRGAEEAVRNWGPVVTWVEEVVGLQRETGMTL